MTENTPTHTEAPAPATQPPAANHTATNGLAVASMVVGLVAFFSGWVPFWGLLTGIAAIVLGVIALKKPTGKGLSVTGIVTGGIAALTSVLFTIFFVIALTASSAVVNETQNKISQNQQMIEAQKDFNKNQTAIFGNFQVKVNSVQRDYMPESTYYQPEAGKEYVVVNLTVKNIGDDSELVAPYTFSLTSNGLEATDAFVSIDSELPSTDLQPGTSVTGDVVFEVNKGASNLKLTYTTTLYDTGYDLKKLVYTLEI